MQLSLFDKRNPLTCEYARDAFEGMTICTMKGTLYTNCRKSIAGDPPHCVHEPLDNSKEACERRREWMHERKN